MRRPLPIFYSALLLTLVNLLLRAVGTSFQVYISGKIGAAGVGLLQLVMSVGSLAMIAGMAGVRTSAMYLTAEELGKKRSQNVVWVLSGCFLYSILCSGTVALALYSFAPVIAKNWIGDIQTVHSLRLLAAFLPVTCLSGVMSGYFTAAKRIGTLAAVEVAEQLCSMAVTMTLLTLWAGEDPGRACESVVLGSGFGGCLTVGFLTLLRILQRAEKGEKIAVGSRLTHTAVPLAMADILKSGITTTENLMVPKRLALCTRIANPLAAFGTLSGMVFPVLMFPACILFGLAELLIPELAGCAAAARHQRIRYLVRRSLKVAMLYGFFFSGILFLCAESLCMRLYRSPEAGTTLRLYALLIPMLYCDAITDAMTKGLGQQKICVRYNILTSAMDVVFLFVLLPEYGMEGYFASFLLTHLVNFLLSLRRLLKITGLRLPLYVPILSSAAGLASGWAASLLHSPVSRCVAYTVLLVCMLCLTGIFKQEDLHWLRGLITGKIVNSAKGASR